MDGVEDAEGAEGVVGMTFTTGGVQTPERQTHSGLGGFVGHCGPSFALSRRTDGDDEDEEDDDVAGGAALVGVGGVALCSTHAPPTHDHPAPGWTPRHPPAPFALEPDAGALDPALCHTPF